MADDFFCPLLTPTDIARLFRVKRRTVYVWSKSGVLPTIRVNGRLRYDRATVAALQQNGLQPHAPQESGGSVA